ncbi:MAG: AAA family ATPase [Zoogloeaceae bacterium]|nr:AAA family ATPase [Zoogloeaceae bacterium]
MLLENPCVGGVSSDEKQQNASFPKIQRFMSDQDYYDLKRTERESEEATLIDEAEPLVAAIERRLHQEHLFARILVETAIREEVLRGLLDRRAPSKQWQSNFNLEARRDALKRLAMWLDDDRKSRKVAAGHAPTPTLKAIFSIIVEAMQASLLEVVVGGYGIGKSKAAEAVVEEFPRSKLQPGAVLIELRKEDNTVSKCLGTVLKRLRHDSHGEGGYGEVCRVLRPGDVLILDEANYLAECGKGRMVDVIRDLWKDTGAGVVLLGNPVMSKGRDGGIVGNDLYGAFLSRAEIHDFTKGNSQSDVEAWMLWKGLAGKDLAKRFVRLAIPQTPGQYGGIRRLENIYATVARRNPGVKVTGEMITEHLRAAGAKP